MVKKHKALKKQKGFFKKHLKLLLIGFFVAIFILINPVPVMVSASEDVFTSFYNSLNIDSTPKIPDVGVQPNIDINKIKKYMTVESAFLGLTDYVSIYFKDLNSGSEFSILPNKSWIPASIIKSFVAADAFEQKYEGLISFDSTVTINADNVVANPLESDDFPRLREGTVVTIGQLVQAMIIQSDNTAYNTLLDILDRRNVMTYLKSLGIENTVVGEKLNVDDNQERRDSINPGYEYNVTTAGDYEKLFDLLNRHKIPGSSDLLSIFKRQKLNSMIPALIPSSTSVAHKTGEWAPIYHDGGIVYKDGSPFILALFSNSNNPSELAKLAQVAYYQDADHVNGNVSYKAAKQVSSTSSINKISLSEDVNANVLGASSFLNTSAVTATDLGITPNDLGVNTSDAKNISYTLITPASPLYGLKILIEKFRLSNATNEEKPALELSFAKERLRELKSISGIPNQNYVDSINANFEDNIKKSVTLSEQSKSKDTLLLSAKDLNDTHFVIMGNSAARISTDLKEKFIDNAYQNVIKNRLEVKPILKNSPLTIASQIEPIVGTVTSVKDGIASVTLDTGKKTDVVLSDSVKIRSFGQSGSASTNSITLGQKIAVVGVSEADGKITPVFIMKDVPKVIPKTQGVVVEIDPQSNLIKIKNDKGKVEDVKVEESTLIKAKDTGVSLEGIKAGSVVTVVGQTTNENINSPSPVSTILPVVKSTPFGDKTQVVINAQSVVINVNGSGKSEVVVTKTVKNTPVPSKTNTPTTPPKSTPQPEVTAPKPTIVTTSVVSTPKPTH